MSDFQDEDTRPGPLALSLARTRTPRTLEIPRETMAELVEQAERDRPIVDRMLEAWLGRVGAPVTDVHRQVCRDALAWGRALPEKSPLQRARRAALTGGPVDELAYLVIEYTRHVARRR